MDYNKWKEVVEYQKYTGFSGILFNDLLEDLRNAENNRDRFQGHLDTILYHMNIDWWDGEFPIEEVLELIKKHGAKRVDD
jgi:hypothetical protein